MIPELGHFSLILTLFVALAQGSLALTGAARGNAAWIAFARPAARVQFLLILISFACLTWAFIAKDSPSRTSHKTPTLNCLLSTASRRYGAVMRARCCCGC